MIRACRMCRMRRMMWRCLRHRLNRHREGKGRHRLLLRDHRDRIRNRMIMHRHMCPMHNHRTRMLPLSLSLRWRLRLHRLRLLLLLLLLDHGRGTNANVRIVVCQWDVLKGRHIVIIVVLMIVRLIMIIPHRRSHIFAVPSGFVFSSVECHSSASSGEGEICIAYLVRVVFHIYSIPHSVWMSQIIAGERTHNKRELGPSQNTSYS